MRHRMLVLSFNEGSVAISAHRRAGVIVTAGRRFRRPPARLLQAVGGTHLIEHGGGNLRATFACKCNQREENENRKHPGRSYQLPWQRLSRSLGGRQRALRHVSSRNVS